jgi:hypothetical protein
MPFEDTQSGAWQGALLGAALPAASAADYEMRVLPGHRRTIDELVDDAVRKKRLFVTNKRTGRSGLSAHMRLGDSAAFSHTPYGSVSEFARKPSSMNMADMAFAGTGSAFPHIETVSGKGRTVDTGLDGKKSPVTRIVSAIKRNIQAGRPPLQGIRADRMLGADRLTTPKNMRRAMRNASYDTFNYMEEREPTVAVVNRPQERITRGQKHDMRVALVNRQKQPYSKTRATLSGLFRLMLPGGDKLSQLRFGSLGQKADHQLGRLGAFCADGVCSALGPTPKKTRLSSLSMPTDFLKENLVGVNLNSGAMKYADKGLRGEARAASAAKNLMHAALRGSSSIRRATGGALAAILGGVGMLGGAAAGARNAAQQE